MTELETFGHTRARVGIVCSRRKHSCVSFRSLSFACLLKGLALCLSLSSLSRSVSLVGPDVGSRKELFAEFEKGEFDTFSGSVLNVGFFVKEDVSGVVNVLKEVLGHVDLFVDLNEDLAEVGPQKVPVGFVLAPLTINLENIDSPSRVSQLTEGIIEGLELDDPALVAFLNLVGRRVANLRKDLVGIVGFFGGLESPSVVRNVGGSGGFGVGVFLLLLLQLLLEFAAVVGGVKNVDLAVGCDPLQVRFKGEFVVGTKAVDETIVGVLAESMGIANPLVPVLVPTNLVLVKARKVRIPVLLVPSRCKYPFERVLHTHVYPRMSNGLATQPRPFGNIPKETQTLLVGHAVIRTHPVVALT